MADDPASRAFAKFCAGGDPQQLGVVFDRLAPELLLVGSRLLPPGADAADLVQQTFLTAIQQRRKFDPQRAVAPWLVGILLQHVRHERRRLRRRLDARRLRAGAAEDPAAVAATREGAEAVRRAVAAMPPPYRQVLQLHLVHGLPVAAIASALERPFRTVQSQLRRGLQQLKRALPAMALAPCPGLASPASLAAVRASVLRAASSLLLGWLWLPWLRLVAAVALVAVPCVVAAAALRSEAPAQALAKPVLAGTTSTREPARPPAGSPIVAARQRMLLQDPVPQCRVRLALFAAEDDAPLVDATLRGFVHDADSARGEPPTRLPAVRANAAGQVELQVARGRRRLLTVITEAGGRADLEYSLYLPDAAELDLGKLRLPRLVAGRLRVRDQHGAPVPFVDVTVGFGSQPFTPRTPPRGQTGTDGWTCAMQLPLGKDQVWLRRLPVDLALGEEHTVTLEIRGGDCEVVLQRPDADALIAGHLFADDGGPIPGGWVQLVRARDEVPVDAAGRMPTDGDGRFVLRVPPQQRGPFRVLGSIAQEQGQLSAASYSPGTTDAELRLRWPDGLQLTVVDDATGEPVEEYGIICFRVHTDRGSLVTGDPTLRFEGRHPRGVLFVDRLQAGPSRLLVLPPADDEWLPSGYLPVQIAEGGVTRLQVRLHRPQPVRVRVQFGDGAPAAHSHVRLRAVLGDQEHPFWNDLRSPRFYSSHWQGRIDLTVAATDERGIAELLWQPWREPVVLRAEGPGHVRCELNLSGIEPIGAPIDLRVARGSTIRGAIADFARLPELSVDALGRELPERVDQLDPGIVLRSSSDGSLWREADGSAFAVGADGNFECADVPPGRWQVLFEHSRGDRGFGGSSPQLLQRPLADVVTVAGRDATTGFDLASVLPGILEGRVFLDGEAVVPEQLMARFHGVDQLGRSTFNGGYGSTEYLQAGGGYRIGRIPPGELDVEATIDGKHYHLLESIVVGAGAHLQKDLQYRHLVARIRLEHADGSPVADRLLRIGDEFLLTDTDGQVMVDPAPALRFEVELYRAGFRSRFDLMQHWYDRERVRSRAIGTIDLDPAQPRSEHRLIVTGD